MSNAVYPTFPGLAYKVHRIPMMSTLTQTSVSGKESRAILWSAPRRRFQLTYEFLRDTGAFGLIGDSEIKTLEGFFLARSGSGSSFLLNDPDDNATTGASLGLGDGSTRVFQLLRAIGEFIEPIAAPNVVFAVYRDGVDNADWTVDSATGLVTFDAAPGMGEAITADFTFYHRVRFMDDELDFAKFMELLWEAGQVEMISVK